MKLKSLIHLILIVFLISITFNAIPVMATPDVIRVPEDYPLIQWAINAANSGDTIEVASGTYHERIVVNKTISLVGQNRYTTIIDAQRTGTVITVTAPKVNITGFTIKNGETWGITGGYLVSNNIVESNVGGVKDAKIVKRNIVRNNGAFGYSESCAILAHNSLIEGNTVSDNFNGIEAHGSTIQNNLVTNTELWGYGLKVGGCLVVGNTIEENYRGIYVSTVGYWGNTIYHNNFIDNEGQVENWEYYHESAWDNGAEGNYWSDYKGNDANGDGVGDTLLPHLNIDKYPLIRPWSEVRTFNTYTWKGMNYQVKTLSNNTIASFRYDHDLKYISFNVTGPSDKFGFCNVTIPKLLLIGEPWLLLMDGKNVTSDAIITESDTETFLYFSYNFCTHRVKIIGTEALDIIFPTADAGSDQIVDEDTLITFDGSNSSDNVGITNYTWTFIDFTSQTLTGVNPAYIFDTPGSYSVTLNVTDAIGNYDTDIVIITVTDITKPIANAGSDKTIVQGNSVTFDAGNSHDNVGIVSFEWDFGDGTTGTGVLVSRTYSSPGTYNITLTVRDAAGNISSDSSTITVQSYLEVYSWWIIAIIALAGVILGGVILWRHRISYKTDVSSKF